MLTHIKGKKFVGDLSLQDADVLAKHASISKQVLEFGSGGSTQILAQCGCDFVISVETQDHWIQATRQRLSQIPNASPVEFLSYTEKFEQQFDLVFVDGVDHLRRQFAIATWQYLKVGGVMLFHDTRRFQDFQNAAWVMQLYHNEISHIAVNESASDGVSSNITVLYKKAHEPYINWNHSEGKPLWAYGSEFDAKQLLWEYR
jgi:hypothetical protein